MRVGSEFRWILEGYTPDTLPMERLAAYMQHLASLLGHATAVHFVRVEKKCVAVVGKVDAGAVSGKVNARVFAVRQRKGPLDAMRAYDSMNEMVAEDRTTARLTRGTATIIRFPGRSVDKLQRVEMTDQGFLVGYLYMLSESRSGFHARLRVDSESGVVMCSASADMAKKLREHLFEPVKVFGTGKWKRYDQGWVVVGFDITSVVRIESISVRNLIDRLRKLEIDWPDDPLGYLADLDDREDSTLQ